MCFTPFSTLTVERFESQSWTKIGHFDLNCIFWAPYFCRSNSNFKDNPIQTSSEFWHLPLQYFIAMSKRGLVHHLTGTFVLKCASCSYSVHFQLSCLRHWVPGDSLGGRFPLLVVIWMNWSTYSANQLSRFQTGVPPDACFWSRFRKTKGIFDIEPLVCKA